MSTPKGYSTQEKDDRLSAQFQTIEPVRELQYGSTVVAHQFVYLVDSNVVCQAGTTAEQIIAPVGHPVLKGDVLLILNTAQEVKVWDVDGQTITLAETLPAAPAPLDIVSCYRHKYPLVDSGGTLITSAVEQATAASGDPLPTVQKVIAGYDYLGNQVHVINTDAVGVVNTRVIDLPPDAATETTLATLATEATVSTLATEATVATLATEATVATLATEATVSTLATEATVATLATEATVSTLATEATVATLGTETTLTAVKTAVETIDNAISGNEMQVDVKLIEGVIDANNTTSTPLLAGGNFTGAWTEIKDYNSINLGVFSDVASATDGLRIEYSFDGVSVHHFHLWTFAGGANGVGYQLSAEFRYFRINYTNGAAPQTTFLLQSNLKPTALFPSSYRASQTFSSQSQVILTKGIIVGETTGGGGGYVAVKVNPSGALTVEADVTASVLPTGAATEAKQDSAISILTTIDGDTGALAGCVSGNEVQVDVVSSALPTGAATEATLASVEADTSSLAGCVSGTEVQVDIVAALPSGTNTIGKVDVNTLSVVDLLDAGILDTSILANNIPGSAGLPLEVVASVSSDVYKMQILDTTGAFIGLYSGPASSENLELIIGPGSDQTIEHFLGTGTRVSLKRLDSTSSVTSGIVAINFIG